MRSGTDRPWRRRATWARDLATIGLWVLTVVPLGASAQVRIFEGPYINGPIYATVEHAGSLVVAGHFDKVGTKDIANIGIWDGLTWRGIGPIFEDDEFIYSLCVVGGDLVAGVTHQVWVDGTDQGLFELHTVQRWDGHDWNQVGTPLPESPRALAIHEGQLFAGLRFAMTGRNESALYRWDGSSWRFCHAPPGEEVVHVRALASHEGQLFVGGSFLSELEPGSFPIAVHAYDAYGWTAVGDGLESDQVPLTDGLPEGIQGVHDLRVVNGTLYATGNFVQTATQIAGLAKWDGRHWIGLPTLGTGHGLVEFRSRLVPFGILAHETGDGTYDYFLGALEESTWTPLEATEPERSRCDPLAMSGTQFNGDLVLARDFAGQNSPYWSAPPVPSLTAWNGSRWRSLVPGESPSDEVDVMLEYEGSLVCGGGFQYVGGTPAHSIAAWDGAGWTAMGQGFDPHPVPRWSYSFGSRGGIQALATLGGELFAGGHFTTENDENLTGVARWGEGRWHALGTGIGDGIVYALVDFEGLLIAGGTFSRAGAQEVAGLASWDGSAWHAYPPGIDFIEDQVWYRRRIEALAVYEGQLYAGGDFGTIGGEAAPYFARWNGSRWEGLDTGPVGHLAVRDLEVHQGKLMVAASTQVLAWAEEEAVLLGSVGGAYSPVVFDLMSDGQRLYATGGFQSIEGVPAADVAIWNGNSWSAPAVPGEGYGLSLARYGDDVYTSGSFERAEDPNRWHMYSFPAETMVPAVSIQLEARPHAQGVELSWELRNGDLVQELRLERLGPDATSHTLFTQTSQRHASPEMTARTSFTDETAAPGERYTYRLVVMLVGNEQVSNEISIELPPLPGTKRGRILAAAPNPFNPVINLTLSVVTPGDVYVDVFDAAGRHVKQLHREALPFGEHEVTWRGLDRAGTPVASGIYTVLLRTPDGRDAERITLLK